MNKILPSHVIEESELAFEYYKASGPGGQNVNKVSSAARLRFNVEASEKLSYAEKQELKRLVGNRLSQNGILIIEAKRFRTQERNRLDAIHRFTRLIELAMKKPKIRIKKTVSLKDKDSRSKEKIHTSHVKKERKIKLEEWD